MWRIDGQGVRVLLAAVLGLLLAGAGPLLAQGKPAAKNAPAAKPAPKPQVQLPELKSREDRLKFLELIRQQMPLQQAARVVQFTSADLDKQLEFHIGAQPFEYTPLISDEAFLRRAYLDLTGKIPSPEEVKKFAADPDRKKRMLLIDQLLETKDYARKWARYWRSVVFHNSNADRRRINPQAFEDWLAEEFEKNTRWDRIVAEMVSASPARNPKNQDDYGQNEGPNNFVLACENKPEEIASQTARLFMGISIQCAECHDHPFDQWKREQFHELAAFFAPGKYYMTDMDDPAKRHEMQARFLLGEKPPEDLNAGQRRVAVAAYLIYNPDNYWFARAYVNRVWNELVGDGFYAVDSLGPDQEVVHKLVVNRLAAMFRYRDFDSKWLFRTIMNSNTYQRDIRTLDSPSKLFTAVRPSRLRPDQVWSSVEQVAGTDGNLQRAVSSTFAVDPSIPQKDLEGSIQQALLLMNNPALQSRLGNSPLKKRLAAVKDDRALVEELFLGVLARRPTDREFTRFTGFLRTAKNRSEAVDDLLWVLVNSTEFLTKR